MRLLQEMQLNLLAFESIGLVFAHSFFMEHRRNMCILQGIRQLLLLAVKFPSNLVTISFLEKWMACGISIFNRYTKSVETEDVCGGLYLKWLYYNPVGELTLNLLVKRKVTSSIFGMYMRSRRSKGKILPFIEKHGIAPESFEKDVEDFLSFDDFFSRKLKKSARPIATADGHIISPCDGRHLIIQNSNALPSFFVKGQKFDLYSLLIDRQLYEHFKDGMVMISRLSPVDYHRFHFPCNCVPMQYYKINGDYFSVNPMVTKKFLKIFFQNKREVTLLKTADVGMIAMIEIGATFIGSIHQSFKLNEKYFIGQEKGYFSFGGSTIITIFENDKVKFSDDLIKNSKDGMETYILMGDSIAMKTK
ncbi:MAG: archaetidylserine decarboxylase [Puniceicoccales bacterium]|jgi:phosphatidylserine decarboxylase|nr:archaetidylserine decarboxylase [Puniceicoccales bacterium]